MARKFYQVTLNGKDIPGIRWALKETARFSLRIEAEAALSKLQAAHPDEKCMLVYDDEWDWAYLIHRNIPEYEEPEKETKSRVYGIREGEVGEERRARYERAMDYASK